MDDNANASQLLSAAITDPFIWEVGKAESLNQWFGFVTASLPLWSLQADAFLRLQPGDLPSIHLELLREGSR